MFFFVTMVTWEWMIELWDELVENLQIQIPFSNEKIVEYF